MGKLNNTKSYLVGAIQYENGQAWRSDFTDKLNSIGVRVLNPYNNIFVNSPAEDITAHEDLYKLMDSGQFDKVRQHMKLIRNLDLSAVDRSDFIVAYINPKVPTIGSIEELTVASAIKRATFIIIEGGIKKCPFWLLAMFPTKYFYNSFGEAWETISKIDSGEIEIDSDRWRLLVEHLR